VNSFEKKYRAKKSDCASARALRVPELKGQAEFIKGYELAEKKSRREDSTKT
jgi:hypothetical protein